MTAKSSPPDHPTAGKSSTAHKRPAAEKSPAADKNPAAHKSQSVNKAQATPATRLTAAQVTQLIDTHFPQANADGRLLMVEAIDAQVVTLRLKLHQRNIRPGGTISGPAMFLLADVAMYTAILAVMGDKALQAVTTNLNINFLSRPQPSDLIAKARLIKLGRRLAVGQIELYCDGKADLVAHATATYAIPPESMR